MIHRRYPASRRLMFGIRVLIWFTFDFEQYIYRVTEPNSKIRFIDLRIP
jgi:hypothetical protein